MAPWVAGGVAALAAAAVLNHGAAVAAEAEYPPVGDVIEVDGVTVHYTDSGGTGDPIVLIHGNGSLVQDFIAAGLVERLATGHRVIAFDRPGYGYTARPEGRDWTAEAQAALLATAAERLGVTQPIVVGHSWGTLVAIAWALARPGDVKALALLAGYYYPTARPDAMLLNIAEVPLLGRVFTDAWAPVQSRLIGPLGNKLVFSPASVTPGFRDGMPFGLILRPGQVRASAEDGAQMPANAARLAERYGELKLPIVVLWGDGDKLVKQSGQSARLVDEVSTAAGKPLPDVGHMIHHVHPGAVAAAILALAG
ncbi:alpha/beta fold hydrolase [Sandarakinorhabdus sp. DWP1-3-1]|uniref:alpha/beta fold hydrolase n=1 Tax=Sandarakinorhabdus sp. DWP1-3-1 TaxID=2804627 RepID=UPI003CF4B23F